MLRPYRMIYSKSSRPGARGSTGPLAATSAPGTAWDCYRKELRPAKTSSDRFRVSHYHIQTQESANHWAEATDSVHPMPGYNPGDRLHLRNERQSSATPSYNPKTGQDRGHRDANAHKQWWLE